MSLPEPLRQAAAAFDSLPGVGPRAALRYAYWLVNQPKNVVDQFSRALTQLAERMHLCDTCGMWSESSPCTICSDSRRNQEILCVIATSPDIRVIEDAGIFKGRYLVLGGTIDPIEGRTPETLNIAKLINRLSHPDSPIKEVILALHANIPGDVTAMYCKQQLGKMNVRVTRLARGLPTGAALEYADAHTLNDAFQHRSES